MDHFGYYMKLPMDRALEGLDILAKIIREPDFPEDEVEKEKKALLEAINHHYDSMLPHAMDLFQQACYGQQPYGLPSVGKEDAIRAISSDSLREWRSRWLNKANAVVSVVGDGDTETLRRLALSILPVSEGVAPSLSNNLYGENNEKVFQVERQQTAAVLGFPGVSVTEEDRYALDLLAEIGSGLAGRFFQAVRGEHGLAYAVHAAHRSRRDCGNFIIYTATSPENELMARDILLKECERFKEEPVTDKELRDAKESINGKWIIGMQTFAAQCKFYGETLAYGLPEDQ
jgi:predicted Zn-dependent peptidase